MDVHTAVMRLLCPKSCAAVNPNPFHVSGRCPAPGERSKSFGPPRSYLNYNKYGKTVERKKKKICIVQTISFATLLYCSKRHSSVFEPNGSFSVLLTRYHEILCNFSAHCILVPAINEIIVHIPSSVSFWEKQYLEKYTKEMKRKLLMNYEQPFRLMLFHGAVILF